VLLSFERVRVRTRTEPLSLGDFFEPAEARGFSRYLVEKMLRFASTMNDASNAADYVA